MSNGFWNNNSQTQHGALPNQFDTKKSLSLSVRWDLQKLFGFDGEELNTLADFINQIDQEGFALSQIVDLILISAWLMIIMLNFRNPK